MSDNPSNVSGSATTHNTVGVTGQAETNKAIGVFNMACKQHSSKQFFTGILEILWQIIIRHH